MGALSPRSPGLGPGCAWGIGKPSGGCGGPTVTRKPPHTQSVNSTTMNDLLLKDFVERGALERLQYERLRETLEGVYNNVPF